MRERREEGRKGGGSRERKEEVEKGGRGNWPGRGVLPCLT